MRQRKHDKAKKKRKSNYHPTRRRRAFMNIGLVMVAFIAITFVLASYYRKIDAPQDLSRAVQNSSSAVPASHKKNPPPSLPF